MSKNIKKSEVSSSFSKYLSKIGAIGGRKSKRILTSEQARAMVEKRIAKAKLKKEIK